MRARKILKWAAVSVAAGLLLLIALFGVGVLRPERELAPVGTIAPIAIVGVSVINPGEWIGARNATSVPPAERKDQTVLVSGDRIVAATP